MVAIIDVEKCDGCAECVESCPTDAISINDQQKAVVDDEGCADCGDCVEVCPTNAISMTD